MANVISIMNPKGGVGKTTLAINLASSLAYLGKRTLLIDSDAQSNCTLGMGMDKNNLTLSLNELLLAEVEPKEVIRPMNMPYLHFIPSSFLLAGVDLFLATKFDNENIRLDHELKKIKSKYDFIIIDCPPGIGLNVNAMVASDNVIIPATCDFFSKEGLLEAFLSVRRIKISFNSNIKVMGIVINEFENNSFKREIEKDIKAMYKNKLFKTKIPRSLKVYESQRKGIPLIELDENCVVSKSFLDLAKEVIKNAKK